MTIFFYTKPGQILDLDAQSFIDGDIEKLVDNLEHQFLKTNTALALFERDFNEGPNEELRGQTERATSQKERIAAAQEWLKTRPGNTGKSNQDVLDDWRQHNKLPGRFAEQLVFLYADLFITKLVVFASTLKRLEEKLMALDTDNYIGEEAAILASVQASVSGASSAFDSEFPQLKRIRNSIAHYEERLLREGPGGRKIEGIGLMLGNLVGSERKTYQWTIPGPQKGDAPEIAEIDISYETLRVAGGQLQKTLNAFKWQSREVELPR